LKLPVSLNRGIELSTGDYIARMDCDDISLPHRLEKQVNFMDKNPEIIVSGSWMKDSKAFIAKYPETHEECHTYKFFNSPLAHPTVIFRRQLFMRHNIRYDPSYKIGEDLELWRRCMKIGKIYNIGEPLLIYRIHGDNFTINNEFYQHLKNKELSKYYYDELLELGIEPTDEKLNLHYLFIRPELHGEMKKLYSFYDIDNWVKRLYTANLQKNIFLNDLFVSLLYETYLQVAASY
jgi:glycosyltransferase involved in cell wall biosynthesis